MSFGVCVYAYVERLSLQKRGARKGAPKGEPLRETLFHEAIVCLSYKTNNNN